jgi:hypothetical protein
MEREREGDCGCRLRWACRGVGVVRQGKRDREGKRVCIQPRTRAELSVRNTEDERARLRLTQLTSS